MKVIIFNKFYEFYIFLFDYKMKKMSDIFLWKRLYKINFSIIINYMKICDFKIVAFLCGLCTHTPPYLLCYLVQVHDMLQC